MTGETIVWFIILSVAPIIGSFAASLLSYLGSQEIPPILPQVNTQSFSQALVATFVLGVVFTTSTTIYVVINTVVLVILFFVLILQAILDKQQQEATQKHVKEVFRERIYSKLVRTIDLTILVDMAEAMIDADFLPDSYTNRLSGYKRRTRRLQFIEIVKSCLELHGEEPVQLTQQDLLVPPEARKTLNRLYFMFTIVSFVLYEASIALSILGQASS